MCYTSVCALKIIFTILYFIIFHACSYQLLKNSKPYLLIFIFVDYLSTRFCKKYNTKYKKFLHFKIFKQIHVLSYIWSPLLLKVGYLLIIIINLLMLILIFYVSMIQDLLFFFSIKLMFIFIQYIFVSKRLTKKHLL